MSLRVTFELNDSDLKHFRLIMRNARRVATSVAPEAILASAENLLEKIDAEGAPSFVTERLRKLRLMIAMLTDLDWRLPYQDAKRVLQALAYFAEPDDLIPDHIPGLGFLDDAIMIELVVRELRHELDAYQDFCDYRVELTEQNRNKALKIRNKWLEKRRKELQERMRRRREKSASGEEPGNPKILR